MSGLDEIRALVRHGERRSAQRDLARLLKSEPSNLEAWLLLAQLVNDPIRKADCYRRVLEIDPVNPLAKQALEWLYMQPVLGMTLPEAKPAPAPTPSKELPPVPEALPEQPLFDWLSLEPTFSSQTPVPAEEVLVPVSQLRLPRRRIRWKWVLIPIAGLILLTGAAFGIQKLFGAKPEAQKPTQLVVSTNSTSVPVQNSSPSPIISPTQSTEASTNANPFTHMAMRIVWSAENKLILWDRGQINALTKTDSSTTQVALSSDGEYAAFNRSAGIWVISVHSTNNERLLVRPVALPKDDLPSNSGSRTPDHFIWLSGTHTLLFNTAITPVSGSSLSADDLFVADFDTGTVTLLLPSGQGGDIYPSPDGKIIAVVSSSTIQLYNLKTRTTLQTFDYDPVTLSSGTSFRVQPVWTPDSQAILVVIPPHDAISQPNAPTRIWRIPTDDTQPEMLAEIHTLGGDTQTSPDLQHLAYVLDTSPQHSGIGELHFAKIDSSQDCILLDSKAGIILGWSTDGSTAAFGVSADPPEIWLLDSASAEARPFTSGFSKGTVLTRFAWVDEKSFLMETRNGNLTQLWLASVSAQSLLLAEDPAGADIPFGAVVQP
jgi:hypothetical protein